MMRSSPLSCVTGHTCSAQRGGALSGAEHGSAGRSRGAGAGSGRGADQRWAQERRPCLVCICCRGCCPPPPPLFARALSLGAPGGGTCLDWASAVGVCACAGNGSMASWGTATGGGLVVGLVLGINSAAAEMGGGVQVRPHGCRHDTEAKSCVRVSSCRAAAHLYYSPQEQQVAIPRCLGQGVGAGDVGAGIRCAAGPGECRADGSCKQQWGG
jgi:hypothetical protein